MPHVLGIDVGNAKVKLCAAGVDDGTPRWTSRPLPYDARRPRARHADFEAGLPAAIGEFAGELDVAVAVGVMTSGYAYPSYTEGARHTMDVLRAALPKARLFAMAIDGRPVSYERVDSELNALPFTNGVGAAHLASRMPVMGQPACGVVIDTGGDTSQVNALVEGEHDPCVRSDPRGPLDHRLRNGKFVWVGSQTTPLESLTSEVRIGDRRYPVIPRGTSFDNVSALLDLLPAAQARKLSLFGLHPKRADALAAVAAAINLDRSMATDEEIEAVARCFYDHAVHRLGAELERALATLPERCRQRAALFGLGTKLSHAAAERAGVPREGIVIGADHMDPELAVIASVYGACHVALELYLDRRLPVSVES